MAQITITIDARNVRQRLRERQDEVEKELDEAKRELKAANARVKEAERLLGRLYEERRGFSSLFGLDDAVLVAAVKRHGWQVRDEEYEQTA